MCLCLEFEEFNVISIEFLITRIAVPSRVARDTIASVIIYTVAAASPIFTWTVGTIIDV